MTTQTHPKDDSREKQRMAGGIALAIFLVSLGVLLITEWWWPGIMVAIGLSSGAALIFRGKTWRGIASLAFFCGFAVVVELVQETDIDRVVIAAMILAGIGVIVLVKALFFREG